MRVYDRGLEGLYNAVEVIDPPDTLRIGGSMFYCEAQVRIVKIAEYTLPEHDGIVILVAANDDKCLSVQ